MQTNQNKSRRTYSFSPRHRPTPRSKNLVTNNPKPADALSEVLLQNIEPLANYQKNKQTNFKSNAYAQPKNNSPRRQGVGRFVKNFIKKNIVPKGKQEETLRIIPLGGCEEVGRNMTVFEYLPTGDIVIVDMGMQFPEEDMLGVDYIIPNTDYLKGKEKNIRAVVFTHGHLDHTGAATLLMDKIGNPLIIGSRLTVSMLQARQEDYKKGSAKNLKIKLVESYDKVIQLGVFKLRLFKVSHNIMDSAGVILETPTMTVIHPGDWMLETDPEREAVNYKALARLKKPTILMLESIGATHTKERVPEREMYKNIEKLVGEAPGRIIIGTFSSMIERVKVILEMAEKYGKKVALDGYSMKTNIEIAKKLGYIKFNLKTLIDIKQIHNLPDNKVVVICTGAQGEENAVLARIANGEHRQIKFKKQDTVIFSSSVIPGNERTVQKLKDLIYRQSDNVIHSEIMDVHSSGHASVEDFKEVIRQISPTYFVPVYANHYMLKEAAKLAREVGYTNDKIFVPDNGSIIECKKTGVKILEEKAVTDPVFVDGLGVSDLQNVVLRDRQILSEDGMLVIIATVSRRKGLLHNPDIISRGFVYLKENKTLIEQVRNKVRKLIEAKDPTLPLQDEYLKNKIRNDLGQFVYTKTGKRPMILPVVIEV
ncbi:MAG TPA: ribonuclease J [bacterium]|nr:ribonuclease J [bacterium]